MKDFSKLDEIIREIEYGLEAVHDKTKSQKANKFTKNTETLSKSDNKLSERIMRVNHMGEVCAQGLYRGQAAFTDDDETRKQLYMMCNEEREHLKICHDRLDELGAKGSILMGYGIYRHLLLGH